MELHEMDINKIYPLGTKRSFDNQNIRIKLKCSHRGCKNSIFGIEGYNGTFVSDDGVSADLRNQEFVCKDHEQDAK